MNTFPFYPESYSDDQGYPASQEVCSEYEYTVAPALTPPPASAGPRAMIEYALAYARRGWRVFPLHSVYCGDCSCGRCPCSSAGKHPRTTNGVHDATTDREQIQRWWEWWPLANIGIATGSGLHVIDADLYKGATLDGLEDIAATLTVLTGSGGRHYYLSCDEPLGNTAAKIAPHIDSRGEGGYVVAPPSRNQTGQYSWLNRGAILPMPANLKACLRDPKRTSLLNDLHQQSGGAAIPTAPLAHADTISAATGVSEARNAFLTKIAGQLCSGGLRPAEVQAALLSLNLARYGNGQHRDGPLSQEEMERTIFKSIVKWETGQHGPPACVSEIKTVRDLLTTSLPDVSWVVPGLIPQGLTLLAGKPKLGKSWLVLDLALSVASGGLALAHTAVPQQGVLYMALEDCATRLQQRTRALLQGQDAPGDFHYALDWEQFSAGGLSGLECCLEMYPRVRLIIIDTLVRVRDSIASKSSVYQEDYSTMNNLRELAHRHGVSIIAVHHTRKAESTDAFDEVSGSTGLTGAVDTTLVLKRGRGEYGGTLHITGRDVEEQELALTFHPENGQWVLDGTAEERAESGDRQAILSTLSEAGEALGPKEVARLLEKSYNNVRQLMRRMVDEGTLSKEGRGKFILSQSHREQ